MNIGLKVLPRSKALQIKAPARDVVVAATGEGVDPRRAIGGCRNATVDARAVRTTKIVVVERIVGSASRVVKAICLQRLGRF